MRLLCADLRQCFTLPVELRRRLADTCFKPPLIVCQIAGIDTGGTQLALLAFNRLGEAVVFNLQPSAARFADSSTCACARVGRSVFLNCVASASASRFAFFQRLAGYGQLSAGFAKAVDFRGLPVQVTQPFCVSRISPDRVLLAVWMDLSGRVAWSTAFSKTSSLRLLLIVVSATLQRLFAPCDELGQAQGIEI